MDGLTAKHDKDTATKQERRRSSVTFAPLPPSRIREHAMLPVPVHSQEIKSLEAKGFRSDYSLGDIIRSRSHMIIETSPESAFQAVDTLQRHDFAFVKRSDGSYSYAILAFRSLEPAEYQSDSTTSLEEHMAFVTYGSGLIKRIQRSKWSTSVRLVSVEGLGHHRRRQSVKRSTGDALEKDGWTPPSIISFIPASRQEDDVSLIGNQSR